MPPIEIVDLADRLDSNEVRSVFLASGYPAEIAEEQADLSIATYKKHPEWKVFGAEASGKPIGMIGIELMSANEAEIRGIAVIETFRNQKIGTKLIQYVWSTFELNALNAETDRDAVDFYKHLGFDVESLGEKYPGVERFWCTLRQSINRPMN